MKNSKNSKRVIGGILGISALLLAVLVVHIVMVTKSIRYDHPSLQLARIDFTEPIDSLKAKEINMRIRKISGVGNTHFNINEGILVYSVDINKTTNEAVYKRLVSEVPYKAERYVVNEEMAAKGCPVLDKASFSYQFSNTITKIFN